MAKPRAIRYLCEVLPDAEGAVQRSYLQALVATGRQVRAFPIGGAAFACDDHWPALAHVFASALAHRFVNVVCAPLCRQGHGPSPAARPPGEPFAFTAFANYLTVGQSVANLAVVAVAPMLALPAEALRLEGRVLTHYDRVIVVAPEHVDRLRELVDQVGGHPDRVVHVPAEPAALTALLDAGGW